MGIFTNYHKKSDETLMISIMNGDHRAFSVLYDRYACRLNGFFYKMLWSDKELAEDQVHELFAKIIERPELFKADYTFKSWVFQVAHNMCKNLYRKRNFELAYRQHLEKEGIELPTIQNELDEAIQLSTLYKILDKLSEERKSMFLLRYQQELTIEEIAITFDLPAGTVKSRLYHIRTRIQEIFTQEHNLERHGK